MIAVPKIDIDKIPVDTFSAYPEEFRREIVGRERSALDQGLEQDGEVAPDLIDDVFEELVRLRRVPGELGTHRRRRPQGQRVDVALWEGQ